ncbi:MAG TPA: hypothetical protein VGQ99_01300 [Tepidisphaeraceae bacterium]|jgi:hypothetical protein|nr:hypothetical protein [Tepidisphaeraceae bacterium]
MPVKLESIVPWGRSFDEYVRMFALSEGDLGRSILDCAAGPSSFGAEMKGRGGRVICADPIYEFSGTDIRSRVEAVRDDMMRQVRGQMGQFCWEYFRAPADLEEVRMGAMERFLEDFAKDEGREGYRVGSLPKLEFGDGEFELALCSHFLFLYSDRLDEAFHIASVRELLRVAREVRIFPVTEMGGRESPHLPAVRGEFRTELVRVEYEFLRGAKEMLVVRG